MADLAPLPTDEREPLLDVLRALALCIVLFDNTMLNFSGAAYLPASSPDHFPGDTSLGGILFRIFISLRSMTVMSFLFGLGFSMQLSRAGDGRIVAMYLRRLAVMIGLGICHIVLWWWGDILWIYALTGLVLLPCRKLSTRALIGLGLALAILPSLLTTIPAIGKLAWVDPAVHARQLEVLVAAIYGSDYGRVISAHVSEALGFHARVLPWFLPWLAGRFIFGLVAGRHRIFGNGGTDFLPLFRKLAIGGFAIAAIDAIVRVLTLGLDVAAMPLPMRLGRAFLAQSAIVASVAMGLSLVVLLWQRAPWRRRLTVLVPLGRMPLTTYLSQSLISTFLFYGWGLGLARHVHGAKSGLVGLAVFAVQIVLSTWWLRRYRLGPMEWIWRTLAYGRRQPMRREHLRNALFQDRERMLPRGP